MKYTKAQLEQILAELKSEKLILTCGKHKYVAYNTGKAGNPKVVPPKPRGCPLCWQAYYYTVHALTAPHLRYEALQELEEVVHKVCEAEDKGKFDFVPDINPTIRYHKDAADDVTGEDKRVILTGLEKIN